MPQNGEMNGQWVWDAAQGRWLLPGGASSSNGMYTPPANAAPVGPAVPTLTDTNPVGPQPPAGTTTPTTTGTGGTGGEVGATKPAVDPVTGEEIGMGSLTGWAGQYKDANGKGFTPEQLRDTVFQNPWYMIQPSTGAEEGSAGYASLRDIGGDPVSLFNIMHGANNMGSDDPMPIVNFLADLYKNLGTAGGKMIDGKQLLQAIMNADTSPEGQNSSQLGLLLGSAGNSSDQSRITYQLYRDAINASGMDPLGQRARQAGMVNALDRYGREMLTTDSANIQAPNQWLGQRYPGLFS